MVGGKGELADVVVAIQGITGKSGGAAAAPGSDITAAVTVPAARASAWPRPAR